MRQEESICHLLLPIVIPLIAFYLWAYWATKRSVIPQSASMKAILMRLASKNYLNRISQYTAAICHSSKCRVSGDDFGNWLNNNNNNKNSWHLARKVSSIPKGPQVLRIVKCSQFWEGLWYLAHPRKHRKGSSPRTVQAPSWKRNRWQKIGFCVSLWTVSHCSIGTIERRLTL